ncbi:hypothetical protein DL93DRAFT_2228455 [Clavulina sp. PMI_390]|nr:hypothetical protein DL93DRAFT_2228455 [Clavulina sp. PMI_390]
MPIDILKGAQFNLPLLPLGNGASIEDAFTTEDPEKPITSGLFIVDKASEPFVYTYKYHEVKIILEGELWLEATGPDEKNSTVIKAVAGDVLRIKKGTVVKFSSPSRGKAFYVGQRAFHDW